jgi:ribonuclease E
MGLIVRTAGAQRTRPEIKRDFDYLIRLWESVRTLTLESQAPSLVYEEGSLIKRSIRDLYTKDVDEVIVEGEEAYREAKDFMKMLMPSHAKNVRLYKEARPLFAAHHIDNQLDALFSPSVTLPSGGYIVINQTEALVAIDINSGKSTREHSIEDTALRTNQEACDEIARQLRLRDLAGLIVVDYIDMDENRNNRSVERRLKEALKNDRARIQVGRISHFGLLEMSRQRLRPGLIEGTFRSCPHCEGRGLVRSVSSCGLGVLRNIEEQLQKRAESLNVKCAPDVASYLLNEKRDSLLNIEQAYGVTVFLLSTPDVKENQTQIERVPLRAHPPRKISSSPVQIDSVFEDAPLEEETEIAEELEVPSDELEAEPGTTIDRSTEDSTGRDGKRRRRRGRRGRGNRQDQQSDNEPSGDDPSTIEAVSEDPPDTERDATEPGNKDEADTGGERRPRGRGKFSRNRGRRDGKDRDREPRQERETSESGSSAEQAEAPSAPPPKPILAQPVFVPEIISEPEVRKWQPPAPTVAPVAQERKAGWWSKRK